MLSSSDLIGYKRVRYYFSRTKWVVVNTDREKISFTDTLIGSHTFSKKWS